MDERLKKFVLEVLETGRDLSLATLREDGYPTSIDGLPR